MKNLAALFLFLMLSFAACKQENCFGEAGAEVAVTRISLPFHQINVYDNINVILTQDSTESITIVAPAAPGTQHFR